MALKKKLEKADYEKLDKGLQALYTADGDGFTLDVEGGFEDVSGLKSALDKERKANKEAAARLKVFEGLDPEEAKAALEKAQLAETEAAMKRGESEKIIQALKDKHAKEIQAQKDENAKLQNGLQTHVIEASIMQAIAEHKGNVKALSALLKGKVSLSDALAPVVMGDDGVPVTISEYLETLKKDEELSVLFPQSSGGGAGKGASNGSGFVPTGTKRSTMSSKEKSDFISKNGLAKFQALPV